MFYFLYNNSIIQEYKSIFLEEIVGFHSGIFLIKANTMNGNTTDLEHYFGELKGTTFIGRAKHAISNHIQGFVNT